jgi:phosphatidylinositol glycan class N
LGYLGWIAYALTTVIDLHVLHSISMADRTNASVFAFSSLLVVLYSAMILQKSPFTYYAYGVFPVFFWEEVFARKQALAAGYKILFEQVRGIKGFSSFAVQALLFIAILQALVRSLLIPLSYKNILLTRTRYNHIFTERFSLSVTFWVLHGPSFRAQSF